MALAGVVMRWDRPDLWIVQRRSGERAMLRGYFDESGEHDPGTGRMVQFTLGGVIASAEAWDAFAREWQAFLNETGLSAFHMTDFVAGRKEFVGWRADRDKRMRVLNQAIDITARHAIQFVGFTNRVDNAADDVGVHYREGLLHLIQFCAVQALSHDPQPIELVFAKVDAFKHGRIARCFGEVAHANPLLRSWSVADPKKGRPEIVLPLQAADIIAYETNQFHRDLDLDVSSWRNPMRQLATRRPFTRAWHRHVSASSAELVGALASSLDELPAMLHEWKDETKSV